jgi:hypothetical protein
LIAGQRDCGSIVQTLPKLDHGVAVTEKDALD